MKKIAFFGGSGGLGREVIKHLHDYEIDSVSSKVVNLNSNNDISNYHYINNDIDVLVIFSNFNFKLLDGDFDIESDSPIKEWRGLSFDPYFTLDEGIEELSKALDALKSEMGIEE